VFRYLLVVLLSTLLAACGGDGGSKKTSSVSIASSLQSSQVGGGQSSSFADFSSSTFSRSSILSSTSSRQVTSVSSGSSSSRSSVSGCTVEGRIVDPDNKPSPNSEVYALHLTDDTDEISGVTDDFGKYSLNVRCNENYELFEVHTRSILVATEYDFDLENTFTIDGAATGAEKSDSGIAVTLTDIKVDRSKPDGVVSFSIVDRQLVLSFLYVNNNYPLTYSFNLVDQDNQVIQSFSGSVNQADYIDPPIETELHSPAGSIYIDDTLQIPTGKIITVTGSVTDAAGKVGLIHTYVGNPLVFN
jgi:hypothetical protein